MAENLQKKPRKSILKIRHDESEEAPVQLQWDEMNILATHHPADKDYGHMKIDEPKTPYSYATEDSRASTSDRSHSLNEDELSARLVNADIDNMEETRLERRTSFSSDVSGDEVDEESKARRAAFENKRKKHYNEFENIRRARELLKAELDDAQLTAQSNQTTEDEVPPPSVDMAVVSNGSDLPKVDAPTPEDDKT